MLFYSSDAQFLVAVQVVNFVNGKHIEFTESRQLLSRIWKKRFLVYAEQQLGDAILCTHKFCEEN